jgi:SAM-dependent methyltransferase
MVRTDIDVLADLVSLEGREVVDVGCGDGALVRALVARGATAVGIEVSEEAVGRACARDPSPTTRYLLGSADALPLADASADVCVMMRSLHHVPSAAMGAGLAELGRVLRDGGVAYVAEPVASGQYYELVSLIDDEREVRELAQAAIDDAPEFVRARTVEYDAPLRISGFAVFRDRVVAADPERASAFAAREPELRERFEAMTEDTAPMRADLLRRC